MIRALLAAWLFLGAIAPAVAIPEPPSLTLPKSAPVPLRFAILKTGEARTLEGFAFAGGSLLKSVTLTHVAVLVEHPKGRFLFDTGLGRAIDAQYRQDMPFWAKPLFGYQKGIPARDQLDAAGIAPITRIIPSHAHWDHASGLGDFPEAEVWITSAERDFLDHPHPGAVLPSQLTPAAGRWKPFDFVATPYASFPSHLDLFGDGSCVLVPLPGHTPGSVGMFLNLPSGIQFFFVGDVTWKIEGIREVRPKFWIARRIVDHDAAGTRAALSQLRDLAVANPDLVLVPAHDAAAQEPWGYFPSWVE